jgi:hypothetical protein
MLIARAAVRAYLNRDFDSFLWMKELAREEILRELASFKIKPKFKTDPWLHQLVCFYIGLCYPQFLFLLDMGLGKTKILADLITHRQRQRKLEGALIFVPRLINVDTWVDDLAIHSDLEPWRCDVSEIEEKRERLLHPKGDVTIIDYPGLCLALTKKEKGKKGKNQLVRDDKLVAQVVKQYNFIGIDESHKVSNDNSLWFDVVNSITKHAEFCYATTGTLFGKDVQDVHAQFYLVDRGETFGENLGLFRAGLFKTKMSPWKGVQYVFDEKMDRQLNKMIQHRSIRYEDDEVPEAEVPSKRMLTRTCSMGDEQREHYLKAVQGVLDAEGNLAKLDAAWIRMRQISSGYYVWDDAAGHHVLPFKHNPKLDLLEAILDEMGPQAKVIVAYDYTETGKIITDRLKSINVGFEWFYGGTKDKPGSKRRFLQDPKCRVFVMNSEAGGTGTDGLQKVARHMILYESPTSPITRKQTLKRINRPGAIGRSLFYDLIMKRSVDRKILESVQEGIDLHQRVVDRRNVLSRDFFFAD